MNENDYCTSHRRERRFLQAIMANDFLEGGSVNTGNHIQIAAMLCAGLLASGLAFGAAAKKPVK